MTRTGVETTQTDRTVDRAPELLVARSSRASALYAVKHWHYSGKLPTGKLFIRGAWEDGEFVGVVIFSRGATSALGQEYGLTQTECVELTRVALHGSHRVPVTQIVAAALRDLRATNPGLRLVVSFADPVQGHHGGIYQAGNWTYVGQRKPTTEFVIRGEQMHMRSVHAKGWKQTLPWLREHIDPHASSVKVEGKHKYLMPLDKATRRRINKLAEPYPSASRGLNPSLQAGSPASHR